MKPSAIRRPVSAKATLEAIAKRPENQQCADCFVAGPRWVSVNIGVFLCIDCSGLHRDLGTHISKIKSITLDDWHHDVVEFLGELGNKVCNAYYEASLPSNYQRPAPKSQYLRDFIQRKYEFKEWVQRGSVLSPADLLRDAGTAPTSVIGTNKAAPQPTEVLLDKPVTGKTRHHSAKKSQRPKVQSPSVPLIDEDIFAPSNLKAPSQAQSQESTKDLLMDFWGPHDAAAPLSTSPTEVLFQSPQSLGYAMEPPSFRRVQEAKTAGAKEAQVQCITDPSSLCLGPPTYQTVVSSHSPAPLQLLPQFPSSAHVAAPANMDPWFTSRDQPNNQATIRDSEDSFASAINRNLDKLSILTSR